MDDRRRQRLTALMGLFDEETAADFEFVILHRHADRVLGVRPLVDQLKEAGLHSQAEELLRRVNERTPEGLPPAAAGLPAPTIPNGVPARPLAVEPRRRGRPPKSREEGSTP